MELDLFLRFYYDDDSFGSVRREFEMDYVCCCTSYVVLDCSKSVFLLQTCLLQRCILIQTERCDLYFDRTKWIIGNLIRRILCIHYFLIKRKKLFGRPNV